MVNWSWRKKLYEPSTKRETYTATSTYFAWKSAEPAYASGNYFLLKLRLTITWAKNKLERSAASRIETLEFPFVLCTLYTLSVGGILHRVIHVSLDPSKVYKDSNSDLQTVQRFKITDSAGQKTWFKRVSIGSHLRYVASTVFYASYGNGPSAKLSFF